MNRIKGSIIWIVHILKKHGLLGYKRQMRYLFAGLVDTAWYRKDISRNECRKFYKAIRKEYAEIRVHSLRGDRIGECIPVYLMAAEEAQKNIAYGILDVFVLYNPRYFNNRLLAIMSRNIHIVDKTNTTLWTYVLSHFPKVEFKKYLDKYRNRGKESAPDAQNTAQYLVLTVDEEKEAEQKKRAMGLQGVFVCASSRDAAYLSTTRPEVDWTYHNWRDSNINFLNLSAEYLLTKNITMVRMGRYVKDEVTFDNCIDYANKYYDELMDVALMKECKFYVGDSSGINLLPMAFNIPCAFKNVVPAFLDAWGGIPQSPHNLFIFKKYYSKIENRFLSIREMMIVEKKCGAFGEKYAEMQIEMVENSAEEILDMVREMNERIDGEWIETDEDVELRRQYRNIYEQWCEQEQYDSHATFHANVGALFLRKNRFLLE